MNRTDAQTAIEYIADRAMRTAANAARFNRDNLGWPAEFGTLAQRGMGISYPTPATAAQRDEVAAILTARGFTVRTNTDTNRRGRVTFRSFTVTA